MLPPPSSRHNSFEKCEQFPPPFSRNCCFCTNPCTTQQPPPPQPPLNPSDPLLCVRGKAGPTRMALAPSPLLCWPSPDFSTYEHKCDCPLSNSDSQWRWRPRLRSAVSESRCRLFRRPAGGSLTPWHQETQQSGKQQCRAWSCFLNMRHRGCHPPQRPAAATIRRLGVSNTHISRTPSPSAHSNGLHPAPTMALQQQNPALDLNSLPDDCLVRSWPTCHK